MSTATLHIDLDAIAANWRALDALSGQAVETAAVVKANAYGTGVGRVARHLAAAGVRQFFVATSREGMDLRTVLGPGPKIGILEGHLAGATEAIGDLDLVPMLNSIEQLTRHFEALPGRAFGIQLDTGMNRLGMEPAEWQAVAPMALAATPDLIISHLACADEPDHPQNAAQLAAFRDMTDGTGVRRSLAATGGILLGGEYHFDLARPGVGLYGGLPFAAATPALRLSVPVIQTREVAAGESVGYGATWLARQPSRIATVAMGYADGFKRALGRGATLWAGRTACPTVGRVSMDSVTVDVTHLGEVPDWLDVIGPHQSIDALAAAADTIGYEMLTSLGRRYARHYHVGER
ncbi:MAG: alanine racemase [Paracoccaceae bacterium]